MIPISPIPVSFTLCFPSLLNLTLYMFLFEARKYSSLSFPSEIHDMYSSATLVVHDVLSSSG